MVPMTAAKNTAITAPLTLTGLRTTGPWWHPGREGGQPDDSGTDKLAGWQKGTADRAC